MDKFKKNEQNSHDNRILRDNFKDIDEFIGTQNFGNKETDETQVQSNRDLRDNFKNIHRYPNN